MARSTPGFAALPPRALRPCALLCAVLAGPGCPGGGIGDATGIRLTVRSSDAPALDQLEVTITVEGADPLDPVRLPDQPRPLDAAGETVELLLPVDHAGKTAAVAVSGLAAGAAVAQGAGEVELVAGELVELGIALVATDVAVCGDGDLHPSEGCDDGDTEPDDGCDGSCAIESGWACSGEPSICTPLGECGDGSIDSGEGCDDGDTDPGDGCDASCAVEAGWVCGGEPSVCARICGNSSVDTGEDCDDGNRRDGDGCSAQCALEEGYTCPTAGSLCEAVCGDALLVGSEGCDDGGTTTGDGCDASCAVESGWTCDNDPLPSVCQRCGDGAVQGSEGCDDGDTDAGDGCDELCAVEPGWVCTGAPSSCAFTCGNSTIDSGEACDDGDLEPGDGCTASCQLEAGFVCPIEGEACSAVCGDGLVRGGEACDDGDTDPGDGCDDACAIELGWTCTSDPEPSVCQQCGNGAVEGGERCDDGDTESGDGCSALCRVEPGYACSGAPSVCELTCGDGDLDAGELCDDGDLDPGDGCGDTCEVEAGFDCPVAGADCLPLCGDGLVRGDEGCDDGDTSAGDGCGATCAVELGYTCSGEPSVCLEGCVIGGLPVVEAALDPNNPCRSCQPAVDPNAYSVRPNGTSCADSTWCDGVETCQGGTCTDGAAECGDDPAYPSCDEGSQTCECSGSSCDDGAFCNGAETCDLDGQCQPGADPCPDQGCDEVDDACLQCAGDGDCPLCQWCNNGSCALQGSSQDLKGECTAGPCATGNCDGAGACGRLAAGTDCGTCKACNASGVCADALTQDADCGACEECGAGGTCVDQQPGSDLKGDCDNGLFCDGEESCDGSGGCQAGSDPCPGRECDDGIDQCTGCTCSGPEICWPACGDPVTGCVDPVSVMTLACQDPVSLASSSTSTCTLGLVGGSITGQAACLSCTAELGTAHIYTSAFDNGQGGCQLDGWELNRMSPGNHCQDNIFACTYSGSNRSCCDVISSMCDTTTFGAPVIKSDRATNCGGGYKQAIMKRTFDLSGLGGARVCVQVADQAATSDDGLLLHAIDSTHNELLLCLMSNHAVQQDGVFYTYCADLPTWTDDNGAVTLQLGLHSNDSGDVVFLRKVTLEAWGGGCVGGLGTLLEDDFATCDLGQWTVSGGTPSCAFECQGEQAERYPGVSAEASSFSLETTVDASTADDEVQVCFRMASESADPGGGDTLALSFNAGSGWQSALSLQGPFGGAGDCLALCVNLSDLAPQVNNNPALGLRFELSAVAAVGVYGVQVLGATFCAADPAVVSLTQPVASGSGLYSFEVTDEAGARLATKVECSWDPSPGVHNSDRVRFTP